jgi:transcriptional regulator with XRE-family HTH domain
MTAYTGGNPATHFGRQMKKERLARGWSLRELSARTEISFTHLSRIENGHRPPTEAVAKACDRVFPERRGWFLEYVRREAPCCIPGSAGRNSEIYSWA